MLALAPRTSSHANPRVGSRAQVRKRTAVQARSRAAGCKSAPRKISSFSRLNLYARCALAQTGSRANALFLVASVSGQTYHMNARVYDPDIHRFLSPDPTIPHTHNPQAFNRYAYSINNPLNLVDKDGFSFGPGPNAGNMNADSFGIAQDSKGPDGANVSAEGRGQSANDSAPGVSTSSPSAPGTQPGDVVVAEHKGRGRGANTGRSSDFEVLDPMGPMNRLTDPLEKAGGMGPGGGKINISTTPAPKVTTTPAPAPAANKVTPSTPATTTNPVKADDFERVRHFTNNRGLNGIKDDNTIKASDQNRVFTEKATGKPQSPRDTEEKLGIGRGRGNNYVEFDANRKEFSVVTNPRTGATERVFQGDVNLTGRNPSFHENRGRR